LKEALNGNIDFGETPISPPLSPFIYRRPLDSRTERELRKACAEIVTNNDEPEQQLNFQPLHATKAIAPKPDAAPVPKQVQTHSTANAPLGQPLSHITNTQSSKLDVCHSEDSYKIPIAQDVSLTHARQHREPSHDSFSPRAGQAFPPRKDSVSTRTTNTINPLLMCPPDRPRTAPFDSVSEISSTTPKTSSTDHHFNYASTAITSAELTPSHISKRASQLVLDNEAYRAAQHQADTEAAMWMRQELEKRRQYAQTTQAPQPPPSRSSARGWIMEVRDFVRPGSSSGNRPGSSSGVRPATSSSQSRTSLSRDRQGSGSIRSSSAQGWRSWNGLRRKSSKSSITDISGQEHSRGQSEHQAHDQGPRVNLNKGLPSLPSLDTWKEPKPKSNGGQHISMLMKASKSKNKAPKSSTVPRKSIPIPAMGNSQLLAAEAAVTASESMPQPQAPVQPPKGERNPPSPPSRTVPIAKSQVRRISAAPEVHKIPAVRAHHSKTSSTDSCFSPTNSSSIGAHHSVDLNRAAEKLVKQESNVDLNKVSERLEKHERTQKMKRYTKSTTSLTHHRHLSDSTNQSRPTTQDGRAPNFSRKISIDMHSRVHDPNVQKKVEITALPLMPQKKPQSSRLRRVLSKLEIHNKTNRQSKSWMDTFEAGGIKTGVMEAHGLSAAPAIKS
jgi:hypothetical protein